ncbi:MAG: hypothetical protein C0498_10110 [Anaerolinea sp.]|nr:hypothetical protein [Anaerolinea sp.]
MAFAMLSVAAFTSPSGSWDNAVDPFALRSNPQESALPRYGHVRRVGAADSRVSPVRLVAPKAMALQLALGEGVGCDHVPTIENAGVLAASLADAGARLARGGTDNYLTPVGVSPLGVRGCEAEALLKEVGVAVDQKGTPFDQNLPNVTASIRIGTLATTTRRMGPAEIRRLGRPIVDGIRERAAAAVQDPIRGEVCELVACYPVLGLSANALTAPLRQPGCT